MEILPGGVTPRETEALPELFSAGPLPARALEALVVAARQNASGMGGWQLDLDVGGTRLQVDSATALAAGTRVLLRALAPERMRVDAVLSEPASTPPAREAMRSALPAQMPLREALQQIASLAREPALPAPLRAAVQQFLARVPEAASLVHADTLRAAVLNSGSFLEARVLQLLTGTPVPGAAAPPRAAAAAPTAGPARPDASAVETPDGGDGQHSAPVRAPLAAPSLAGLRALLRSLLPAASPEPRRAIADGTLSATRPAPEAPPPATAPLYDGRGLVRGSPPAGLAPPLARGSDAPGSPLPAGRGAGATQASPPPPSTGAAGLSPPLSAASSAQTAVAAIIRDSLARPAAPTREALPRGLPSAPLTRPGVTDREAGARTPEDMPATPPGSVTTRSADAAVPGRSVAAAPSAKASTEPAAAASGPPATKAAAPDDVSADLKGRLLGLQDLLARWLETARPSRGVHGQPSATSPAQRAGTQALYTPRGRMAGAPPDAAAPAPGGADRVPHTVANDRSVDPASGGPPPEPEEIVESLLRYVTGALARTRVHQLVSHAESRPAADATTMQAWSVELPVAARGRFDGMELLIEEQERRGEPGAAPERVWQAVMSLEIGTLGPLHALLRLSGARLSTTLWFERAATLAIARTALDELAGRLRAEGIEVARLECLHGSPPPRARAPERLLEVRT